ncbi:hypothetical protein MN608_01740 [Microdochium nivale]|nr:hypothetical protein MN608_01740 [Microdochium nivale]
MAEHARVSKTKCNMATIRTRNRGGGGVQSRGHVQLHSGPECRASLAVRARMHHFWVLRSQVPRTSVCLAKIQKVDDAAPRKPKKPCLKIQTLLLRTKSHHQEKNLEAGGASADKEPELNREGANYVSARRSPRHRGNSTCSFAPVSSPSRRERRLCIASLTQTTRQNVQSTVPE